MIEDCAHDTRTWQRRTSYLQLDNHLGVYGNISNIFKQRAIFLKKKEKKCDARAQHTRIHVNIHIQYIYIYIRKERGSSASRWKSTRNRVESSRVEWIPTPETRPPRRTRFFLPGEIVLYIYRTRMCVVWLNVRRPKIGHLCSVMYKGARRFLYKRTCT